MTFTVTTIFKISSKKLYTAWLSSKEHSAMTGGEANTSNVVGESFSAWDGYISGKNIELIPNTKIIQSWRTDEFSDKDKDSKIEITFKELNGETELTLIHSNVPKDGEKYKQGWEDFYFTPMKNYFSKK